MRGIELEIPPELAAALRRPPPAQDPPVPPPPSGTDEADEDDPWWHQRIPLPAGEGGGSDAEPGTVSLSDSRPESDDLDGDGDDGDDGDGDGLSAPPATAPVLLVDLRRLQGFPAASVVEAAQTQRELAAAVAGPQFWRATRDWLGAGVAAHGERDPAAGGRLVRPEDADETTEETALYRIVLDYPGELCVAEEPEEASDAGAAHSYPTTVLWHRVARPHAVPVADRLFRHLRHCHRDLYWKYQLRGLLEDWIRRRQLRDWRTRRRQEQLQQLYQVHEAFQLRIEMARQQNELLERERDHRVQEAMKKRRLLDIMGLGAGTELGILDQSDGPLLLWGQTDDASDGGDLQEALLDDGDSAYDSEDDESSLHSSAESSAPTRDANDDEGPSMDVSTATTAPESTDSVLLRTERRRERHRAKRAARQRERLAQRKEEECVLAREQGLVREALTTHEHKAHQAVLAALEGKLERVDALIESLQDEEWQDEEEEEEEEKEKNKDHRTVLADADAGEVPGQLSLLDRILAMVLSALGKHMQSDHEWLRNEHREIKSCWLEYFGTLPSLSMKDDDEQDVQSAKPSTEDHVKALRSSLGLQECIWDEETDEPVTGPQKVGLRPGGRAP